VDEADGRRVVRIAEVGVVGAQLGGAQEALVDERPGRQGRDEERVLADPLVVCALLDPAPDDVELAGERLVVAGAPFDEDLAHHGLGLPRQPAERVGADRDVTPAEDAMSLLDHDAHEQLLAAQAQARVARQEDRADGVLADRGQLDVELVAADAPQEAVGDLRQDPGAVTRLRVGPGGAAMVEVLEHRDGLVDQLVRRVPVEADERTQPQASCSKRGS
jgi:hypothetical protein